MGTLISGAKEWFNQMSEEGQANWQNPIPIRIRDTGEARSPGVPDTEDSQIPCVLDTGESPIPGVPDTGESLFDCWLFFQISSQCCNFKKNNQSKNCVKLVVIVHTHLIHFLLHITSSTLLTIHYSRCHFKIWIAPLKIAKNKNSHREPLIGWVVWWKNPTSEFSCYSP